MSEVIEGFKLMKQAERERRANNLVRNTKRMKDEGVKFASYNNGYQLMINIGRNRIDFWPSSGRWIGENEMKGRGVESLLAYIKSLNNP